LALKFLILTAHAMIESARVALNLNKPWHEVMQIYLEAYTLQPQLSTAIHAIAQYYFNHDQFHLAYMYALHCAQMPLPEQLDAKRNVNFATIDMWLRDRFA
jgi:uncharacterized integral membrane protein